MAFPDHRGLFSFLLQGFYDTDELAAADTVLIDFYRYEIMSA
jgi:hypothetical protein